MVVEINKKLAGFELEALSLLLHFWAEPKNIEKKEFQLEAKIKKLRAAVIAGIGKGNHEAHIPRELAYHEYKTIKFALQWLKTKCRKDGVDETLKNIEGIYIPHEVKTRNGKYSMERSMPISLGDAPKIIKSLIGNSDDEKISLLAHKIVAKRLGCSRQKIKDATLAKNEKRIELNSFQQFLVSVFIDLCSEQGDNMQTETLAYILNVLFNLKTPILIIFYLVQRMHTIVGKQLFIGEYDLEDLKTNCELVCENYESLSFEPFTRLF